MPPRVRVPPRTTLLQVRPHWWTWSCLQRVLCEKRCEGLSQFQGSAVGLCGYLLDYSEGDGERNPAFLKKRINTRNKNYVVAALLAVIDAAAFSSCRQTEVGGEEELGRNAGVWAKDQLAQVNKALRKRRRMCRNLRRRWLLGEMFLRRRRRVWHLWRRRRMPSEVVATKVFSQHEAFREGFLRRS